MSKTLLVMRNEVVSTFSRRSFQFAVFGLPLVATLVFLGASLLRNKAPSALGGQNETPAGPELRVEGYVDQSGLITAIPPDVPQEVLLAYPDEASAGSALQAGEIAAFYLVPADYVEKGDLIYYNPDYSLASRSTDQSWVMRRTIFANLLGNDPERIERAWNAMDVQVQALVPSTERRDDDNPLTFLIPYATTMLIYIVIMMAASLLLNSIGEEKKNRVLEILLLSASPRQMLTGKIIALGLLGLLQALIWVSTGYTLLRLSGSTLSLPAEFELPLSILGWALVFFLLGYAVYASLMAGLGALAPSVKEASQGIILVIWPMLIPLFFMVSLIEDTHGAVATGLSLFPLTAPVAMMTRLAVGGVPIWQPFLAVGLLLIAVFLIVRTVAGMFHAQTLLSGQSLSARRFFSVLLGRA